MDTATCTVRNNHGCMRPVALSFFPAAMQIVIHEVPLPDHASKNLRHCLDSAPPGSGSTPDGGTYAGSRHRVQHLQQKGRGATRPAAPNAGSLSRASGG